MVKEFKHIEFIYNFHTNAYRYAFGTKDDSGCFYAAPMCSSGVLKYDIFNNQVSFIGNINNNDFGYTGADFDIKRNCIWCYPRNKDSILKIDLVNDSVTEIPLGIKFNAEGIHGGHHYSGCMTEDIIYCPPRHNSNGILKIHLDTYEASIIDIDKILGFNSHYCGSLLTNDGKICFTPGLGNYFTFLNPVDDSFEFIGEKVDGAFFGGTEVDGVIYSIGSTGIVKIENKKMTWIYRFNEKQHFYGTVCHPNGRIYSWNNKNQFVEFDIDKNELKVLATIYDSNNAPVFNAGGIVMDDENIYFSPCQGRFFMRAVFE